MTRTDRIALLAIVLPAVAGTLTLGPLALHFARRAVHVPPVACLAAPATPMIVQPAPLRTPHPSPGRVEASNIGTRDIWQGRFAGPVILRPEGVVVSTKRAEVHLLPEAPRGMLRGLRVDLAEPTPDGSWRNGHAPLAHAHVPWHLSVDIAERAARMGPRRR